MLVQIWMDSGGFLQGVAPEFAGALALTCFADKKLTNDCRFRVAKRLTEEATYVHQGRK